MKCACNFISCRAMKYIRFDLICKIIHSQLQYSDFFTGYNHSNQLAKYIVKLFGEYQTKSAINEIRCFNPS